MTEGQIALARRAVACRRWRWMSGMRWWTEDDRGRLDHYQPDYMGRPLNALPDLTDPATLGCLLALVREAWQTPKAYVASRGEGLDLWVVCLPQPRADHFGHGANEADALVRALEAAP
jgi:hypothetical protein